MSRRRKDDTPRIFDVSKRHHAPEPAARPIIVGHRPVMPDPMTTDRPLHHVAEPFKVTSVPVKTDDGVVLNGDYLPRPVEEAMSHITPAVTALDSTGQPEPSTPGDIAETTLPAIEAAATEQPPMPPILSQQPHDVNPQHSVVIEPMAPPLPLEAPAIEQSAAQPEATAPQHLTTAEIGQAPGPTHPPLAAMPPVPAHPEAQLDQSHLAGSLTSPHSTGISLNAGHHKLLIGVTILAIILAIYTVVAFKATWPLPFIFK